MKSAVNIKVFGWIIHGSGTLIDEAVIGQIRTFLTTGNAPEGWGRLKSAKTSLVWKFPADGHWYLMKIYLERSPLDGLKSVFVGSRVRKAWRNSFQLAEKGFATPKPLLFGEKKHCGYVSTGFMVTGFLDQASGFHAFLKSRFGIPLSRDSLLLKRRLLNALGAEVGRMHANGIVHGDLRPNNILISTPPQGPPVFSFIDNERNAYFPSGIPDRLRLKNLVQLNMVLIPQITFTDRLRFFKAYLRENPTLNRDARKWMLAIHRRTRVRLWKKHPSVWQRTSK